MNSERARHSSASSRQIKHALLGSVCAFAFGLALTMGSSPAAAKSTVKHKSGRDRAEHISKEPFGALPKGPLQIFISINQQKLHFYSDGTHVEDQPVATGVPGHLTPMGVFSVIERDRYHHSNIYDNAPMPYMERITWSGVAMHEGPGVGHQASHGCIRMPHDFAARLWQLPTMGMRVIIARPELRPTEFADSHLFVHKERPAVPTAALPETLKTAQTIDPGTKTDAVDPPAAAPTDVPDATDPKADPVPGGADASPAAAASRSKVNTALPAEPAAAVSATPATDGAPASDSAKLNPTVPDVATPQAPTTAAPTAPAQTAATQTPGSAAPAVPTAPAKPAAVAAGDAPTEAAEPSLAEIVKAAAAEAAKPTKATEPTPAEPANTTATLDAAPTKPAEPAAAETVKAAAAPDAAPTAPAQPTPAETARTAAPSDAAPSASGPTPAAPVNAAVTQAMPSTPAEPKAAEPANAAATGSTVPKAPAGSALTKPGEAETAATAPADITAPITLDDVPLPLSKPARLATGNSTPIAIFVSRKEGKIYVRQNFTPVFEAPVKIEHPDQPLGTHVFTAMDYLADHATFRWTVVSLPGEPAKAVEHWKYVTDVKGRRKREPVEERMPKLAQPLQPPETPQQALARIEIPQDVIDQISQLIVPGSSLVVSDQGLGPETGSGTDFIVIVR